MGGESIYSVIELFAVFVDFSHRCTRNFKLLQLCTADTLRFLWSLDNSFLSVLLHPQGQAFLNTCVKDGSCFSILLLLVCTAVFRLNKNQKVSPETRHRHINSTSQWEDSQEFVHILNQPQ